MEKYKVEIKWCFIFSGIALLWMYFEKAMGWHDAKANLEPFFNLLFIPIFFLLYFFALRDKRKTFFNNKMNWKQGFMSGLILSVLITITTTTIIYFTFLYISPNFFGKAIELSKNKELAQQSFNLPVFVKNNIFDKLSFGVVFSAILSYFLKTQNVS